MIVLSLFDGISCGMVALKRAGIKVDKYYSSEIDKYSIAISKKNHPEIIHLGDINNWKTWKIEKPDLIIGGSPCQGFSFAGKGLNFNDYRSKLFFVFIDILKKYNPKYFLLENVVMNKKYENIITDYIGVNPICLNSALVSAQNRNRLYWFNWNISDIKDKGKYLKDILEYNTNEKWINCGRIITRRLVNGKRADYNPKHKKIQRIEIRNDSKTGTLTSVQKDNIIVFLNNKGNLKKQNDKSNCIDANYFKGVDNHAQRTMIGKFDLNNKLISYRKLTPIECERLQTLPDNYTEGVSNTQRYKMLGNGWTVDIITHILKGIK